MIPVPPTIIECPHCNAEALKACILSGNTFDAVSWSDGKMKAPMLPDFPRVVKYHSCKLFYWVKNARETGEVEDLPKPPHPGFIDFPTLNEYIELLYSDQLGDGANEKYVRTYLWWVLNDLVRGDEKNQERFDKYHDLFIDNLDKLKKQLDPVIPEDRLMIAEIHRETGDFEKALACLKNNWPNELKMPVFKIMHMVLEKDKTVFRL